MKRIMIFSNMYPSAEHPTFGIFVKNQVELLQKTSLTIDTIVIDEPGKGKVTTLKKYMSWFFHALRRMFTHRKELSLTHAHYAFPTGFISYVGKKWFNIPYVITVHGGDLDKMAAKNAVIKKMIKRILLSADAVIVVGEKLKQDVLTTYEVPAQRVHVMSMGVDTTVFQYKSKEEARQALQLPTDEKLLLFVGNMIEAKGVLELVEAFKQLLIVDPNLSLHFIGSSKDRGFMETFSQQLVGYEDQIHHHEPMPQQTIAFWMAAADVFVLPSHHEGFGLVALEAMATGTTVVGADVGGLSYLLKDGAGILVAPRNASSLADGLQEALQSQSTTVNVQVMEQLVAEQSYEVIVQRLLAIYESIATKRNESNA